MADNNTVARPYAQAIFEIADSKGELAAWSESLAVAGQLLTDRELVDYLGPFGTLVTDLDNRAIRVTEARRVEGASGAELLLSIKVEATEPVEGKVTIPIQLELDGARTDMCIADLKRLAENLTRSA